MKYCSTCGAELHDDAVICPQCGCAVPGMKEEIAEKKTNSMAIVGFILSFFVSIAGLVLGILGLKKSKTMNGEGKGFAVAAITISAATLFFSVLMVLIVFLTAVGH